ncbi:GntR family transcriptional regulator [Sphingomonas sp. MG17]|uniref:GntR family transcriptional regulator n=1 Tax=Sphingomonas tagetis TaxID=2949092 RepID=A0A9X2KM57_9SPHN|nr:GntR family transcriptional regulator [Sphingomonas tagetis]MCP3731322.1 GntR family transcriptional regulator [Sphingomonas tagetis]
MPPDASTQERVYRALKAEYLDGIFHAGMRLDLHAVADRHRASTTPVREAIQRMVGEQLFESHPDGGIRVVCPDIDGLASLYVWNAQHLLGTLRLADAGHLRASMRLFRERAPGVAPGDHAAFTAILFRSIGEATGNSEFADQIQRMNERLHYSRLAEAALFDDPHRELRTFLRNGSIDVRTNIRRRIIAYHRRRIDHVVTIARMLKAR